MNKGENLHVHKAGHWGAVCVSMCVYIRVHRCGKCAVAMMATCSFHKVLKKVRPLPFIAGLVLWEEDEG